ncbi:MAG: hypothetical protein NZ736_01825 [Candidatus Poseidoniaceae archaeon]|nr:hypothetical protein [Candidatus Poseidoniaceae archaeon]
MREVDTAIGTLTLPKELPQERVDAEIKGIKLFKEIIDSSKSWKLNDAIAKRPTVYCRVGDLKIVLDPFQTIENCYFINNFHFILKINRRKVCVLESHNSNTAYIDPLISLLLLGEARWPMELTPKTMEKVSIEQQIIDHHLGLECKAESIRLAFNTENKKQLLQAIYEIENGNSQDGLASIFAIARLKYVCSMWTMNHVIDQIRPYVNACSDEQIAHYIENPFEQTDRIFLEKMIAIPNI